MAFQIHLLRLGRIYKPKFDIILYHNFKPKAKLGVVYPLKESVINNKPLKVVSLNIELVYFWVSRGVVLPKWLAPIYDHLYQPSIFHANKIYNSPIFHHSILSGKTIYHGKALTSYSKNPNKASPKFKFFKGKYIMRHWLRLQTLHKYKIINNTPKNEKNST